MDLKSFDWHKLKRLASPQATNDLNDFLEAMPQNAGKMPLIAAGFAWAIAGTLGLFTTVQMTSLTELRAELAETKALQPMVPRIKDAPVKQDELKAFAQILSSTYPGLMIKQQGAAIQITSGTTANFGQFREAIGHVQNGGSGWRVSVEKLCVGRECDKDKLGALLKINKVTVDKPS